MGEEGVDLNGEAKKFEAAVVDAFRPVHVAVGEALARLAEFGITGRTATLERMH
jgi:hypothetical protein